MITCVINKKVAYPATEEKIKVTLNNPYIQDSGSYTYDISFPMSIHANQLLFGNIHRFDVSKRIAAFDDCKLYAAGRLFISGKGTVTSVSDTTVKLQVVGGKSRIKYNSKFEKHFIDNINYDIDGDSVYGLDSTMHPDTLKPSQLPGKIYITLDNSSRVGCLAGIFNPVWDETNERFVNDIRFPLYRIPNSNGQLGARMTMHNIAIQPSLQHVLTRTLQSEGYKQVNFRFDTSVFGRLYIANARQTTDPAKALPHWTVYKFLDEVSKLMNVALIFDDIDMVVDILPIDDEYNSENVTYECVAEYSCEYDEDSVESIYTSNIDYSFDSSTERSWSDCIPADVQKVFDIKEYNSMAELLQDFNGMSDKLKRRTIFKTQGTFYLYANTAANWDDSGKEWEHLVKCGFFSPIVRDRNSDSSISVNIVPVAIARIMRGHAKPEIGQLEGYLLADGYVVVPSIPNDSPDINGSFTDDDGDSYCSVQEAIEGGAEDVDEEEQENDDKLSIFIASNNVFNLKTKKPTLFYNRLDGEDTRCRYPVSYSDFRACPEWSGENETASLSLNILHGLAHVRYDGSVIEQPSSGIDVDSHNLLCIKFLTDDIPDPSKIYIFHNRRFICQKVELEVSGEGISRLKTGYFYEIL